MAAFESAIRTFALAGDAMHVNNARYMMAATAAESGLQTRQALRWVEDCATYARATGNIHELAHALFTRASLFPQPRTDPDLEGAVETFRAVGDLRCLARSQLLMAADAGPTEQVGFLEAALDVARKAHDLEHQCVALEQLVGSHWASGDRRAAAVALGALVNLVGHDRATARCPVAMLDDLDDLSSVVAEGQAHALRPTW